MKKMVWMAIAAMMMVLGVESMARPLQRVDRGAQFSAVRMAEEQTDRLVRVLDLSKRQAKQVYAVQLACAKQIQRMQWNARPGGRVSREAMRFEMQRMRREVAAKYRRILSERQYRKWLQLDDRGRDYRGGHASHLDHGGRQIPKMQHDHGSRYGWQGGKKGHKGGMKRH